MTSADNAFSSSALAGRDPLGRPGRSATGRSGPRRWLVWRRRPYVARPRHTPPICPRGGERRGRCQPRVARRQRWLWLMYAQATFAQAAALSCWMPSWRGKARAMSATRCAASAGRQSRGSGAPRRVSASRRTLPQDSASPGADAACATSRANQLTIPGGQDPFGSNEITPANSDLAHCVGSPDSGTSLVVQCSTTDPPPVSTPDSGYFFVG